MTFTSRLLRLSPLTTNRSEPLPSLSGSAGQTDALGTPSAGEQTIHGSPPSPYGPGRPRPKRRPRRPVRPVRPIGSGGPIGSVASAATVVTVIAGFGLASACVVPPPPGGGGTTTTTTPPPAPTAIDLAVRETAGVARSGEVATAGVPLPRNANVTSTGMLRVTTVSGQPVPAQFDVLARWNAPLTASAAPIQWVLVSFPATVNANTSGGYRLVLAGGGNPAPPTAVAVSQTGNRVIVNTGAATFDIDPAMGGVLREARLSNGTVAATSTPMTAMIDGVSTRVTTVRGVRVERSGPLMAAVVVDVGFDRAPLGSNAGPPEIRSGGVGGQLRYQFGAGSPTAVMRASIQWEGTFCSRGDLTCGPINAVSAEDVHVGVALPVAATRVVTGRGARTAAPLTGTVASSATSTVGQLARPSRTAPMSARVTVPGAAGSPQNGTRADGAVLTAATGSSMTALASDHLHRYEPAALELDGTSMRADLADTATWLGSRQGFSETFGIGALPATSTIADVDRLVWAPVNRPLRPMASAAAMSGSQAMDAFAPTGIGGDLAGLDSRLNDVMARTLSGIDSQGIVGANVFGLYPRYWGSAILGDEIDCGGNDPTPADDVDDAYWCGTWTDYHSASSLATIQAFRTGDPSLLDELGEPAAYRMLHTQLQRCAPADEWFYCGQAPSGYGGFRADFNSSHAYFDNLFLTYWLTGDSTIPTALLSGADSMRSYLCPPRAQSGRACNDADPQTDEWALLGGRVGAQWLQAFRFLGLASTDGSFLDDHRTLTSLAVTRHAVQVNQNGQSYAFWLDRPVTGSNNQETGQLWMASQYDLRNIWRLMVDTNDTPIGTPSVRPSELLAGWGRSLLRFGATAAAGGDGTANGAWANSLSVSWTGNRIGGQLTSATWVSGGGDPLLYTTGKACLVAVLSQAGTLAGDATMTAMAHDLAVVALNGSANEAAPLGKIQGEYFHRLLPGI